MGSLKPRSLFSRSHRICPLDVREYKPACLPADGWPIQEGMDGTAFLFFFWAIGLETGFTHVFQRDRQTDRQTSWTFFYELM